MQLDEDESTPEKRTNKENKCHTSSGFNENQLISIDFSNL